MLKNILRVLSANGVVAIIGFLSSLFLPKVLPIEEYAIYQSFVLYLSYISVLHLGFPSGMNIKYAGVKLDDIDKKQYKAEMWILFLVLMLFSVNFFSLSVILNSEMMGYISLMIFPYCFLSSFSVLLQAWEKFQEYAILHTIVSAGPLALPMIVYICTGQASGRINIYLYILVYVITTIICLVYHARIVKGIESNRLVSKENWETEKIGFCFLLGNYISLLIHSVDKQFANWFCTAAGFSYYSFALTMQNVMTIFITAISQPLFPHMAAGRMDRKAYVKAERVLLLLGSFSGIAYFLCDLVVKLWIPNYIESLSVIRVYFAVFPAMSIVNSLYLNMYKARRLVKRYILDLILVLAFAVMANIVAVKTGYGYIGIAIVTVILYYVWLIYGTCIFEEMRMGKEEVLFVISFFVIYTIIPNMLGGFSGIIAYLVLDIVVFSACFPNEIKDVIRISKSLMNKGRKM